MICQSNIFSNTERNQFVKVLLYEALCSRKPDPCFVDNSIDIAENLTYNNTVYQVRAPLIMMLAEDAEAKTFSFLVVRCYAVNLALMMLFSVRGGG